MTSDEDAEGTPRACPWCFLPDGPVLPTSDVRAWAAALLAFVEGACDPCLNRARVRDERERAARWQAMMRASFRADPFFSLILNPKGRPK